MTHQHADPQNCRELLGSISAYVDGDLSDELCQELQRHMSECEHCRVVVDTTAKMVYLYRQAAQEVTLSEDAQERLMNTLNLRDFLKPGE